VSPPPLRKLVPHQHRSRIPYSDEQDLKHKNGPHVLMEDGKPGPKWQASLQKVKSYL